MKMKMKMKMKEITKWWSISTDDMIWYDIIWYRTRRRKTKDDYLLISLINLDEI